MARRKIAACCIQPSIPGHRQAGAVCSAGTSNTGSGVAHQVPPCSFKLSYLCHACWPGCLQTLSKFSNNYPVAVVYPASTEQVQAAVKCAKASRVKVLPRGGNHGNEGAMPHVLCWCSLRPADKLRS